MEICLVCGNRIPTKKCGCGFDISKNYDNYRTLGIIPKQVISVYQRRKEYEKKLTDKVAEERVNTASEKKKKPEQTSTTAGRETAQTGKREIPSTANPVTSSVKLPDETRAWLESLQPRAAEKAKKNSSVCKKEKAEAMLKRAVLNKNNKVYSMDAGIPKSLQKLLKYQTADAKVNQNDILFALTVEGTLGASEGILLTEDCMLFLSRSESHKIYFNKVKDAKTDKAVGGGLSIKVTMDDGTTISTGIKSRNYRIAPILSYLKPSQPANASYAKETFGNLSWEDDEEMDDDLLDMMDDDLF